MKLGVNEGVGVVCWFVARATPNTVILHIETVTSHQQLIAHFIYIN